MSNALLVCYRHGREIAVSAGQLARLGQRIAPEIITAREPVVIRRDGLLICIFNPNELNQIAETSICLGSIYGDADDWWKIGRPPPNGTYALFRANDRYVELVTDVVASRTVWHAATEEIFVASTCQRAMMPFLGSFEPDVETPSWMLSSGSLGPGHSWDARIKPASGNARVRLDRAAWALHEHKDELVYKPTEAPDSDHKARLLDALNSTSGELRLDCSKWVVSLSGGYDSRATVFMLKDKGRVRTITWGSKSSLREATSDAFVATRLAENHRLDHEFLETDRVDEPIGDILRRYVLAAEGRTANPMSYMDGLRMRKGLFEAGVLGIVIGDEIFSNAPEVFSELDVRNAAGLLIIDDIRKLHRFRSKLVPQHIPKSLHMRDHETLEMWRDRLHLQTKIPVVLAGKNMLATQFFELCNPLLSRQIVMSNLTVPDRLRARKRLFREVVSEMSPVGFATSSANRIYANVLSGAEACEFLRGELNKPYYRTLFSDEFIDFLRRDLARSMNSGLHKIRRSQHFVLMMKAYEKILAAIYYKLPIARGLLRARKYKSSADLAFRVYITCAMHEVLKQDAALFQADAEIASSSR